MLKLSRLVFFIILSILISFYGFSLIGCSEEDDPTGPNGGGGQTGTVTGAVTDSQTNNFIVGVTLSSDDGKTTITDSTGSYSFTLTAGSRSIEASAAGYSNSSRQIVVTADGNFTINFSLDPLGSGNDTTGTLRLTVKDQNGAYVNGSTVQTDDGSTISPPDNEPFYFSVNSGWRLVWARRSGYENGYVWGEVAAGDTLVGIIRMTEGNESNPHGAVKWTVTDAVTGDPVADAWVNNTDSGTDFDNTDANGIFFGVYSAGNGHFQIEKPGYTNYLIDIPVIGGVIQEFRVELIAGGGGGSAYVFGRVIDETSGLSIDTGVDIVSSDGVSTVTDGNGHYSMTVGTGSITFTASADGWQTERETLELVNGAESELNFELSPSQGSGTGNVFGTVLNTQTGEGEPEVTVFSDDGMETTTDNLGVFSFDVDAGDRLITLSKNGFLNNSEEVTVVEDQTSIMHVWLTPQLDGELRLILSWGLDPLDLDSYMRTPVVEGSVYIIKWDIQGEREVPPYVTLDNDEKYGYGPESITIYEYHPGQYEYWVHNYSDWPPDDDVQDLAGSGAKVTIQTREGIINTVVVPEVGEGNYWRVCQIDGSTGEIEILNIIDDEIPFTEVLKTDKAKH